VDGTSSGLCAMVGFGVSGVKFLVSPLFVLGFASSKLIGLFYLCVSHRT
jgi:hypothetical protein